MQDKNTKIWLSVFVLTLTIVGASVSYMAQGRTLYQGLVALSDVPAQASILNFDEETTFESVMGPSQTSESQGMPDQNTPGETPANEPQTGPKLSPCADNEVPVIKNGQFTQCRVKNEAPVQEEKPTQQLGSAPKVKIAPKPTLAAPTPAPEAPPSCESQGYSTYTGPDRPGVLYGMCVGK